MRHLDHSPGLILVAALVALLGLSACGSSAPAPPAAAPASTAASIAGDFVGKSGQVDAIALSTNGQLIAYICNGTATHAATFAVWFKGAVSHNAASVTAANGSRLAVTWTAQEASGTVTLNGGQSFSFTAPAAKFLKGAGLYRSAETFAGVRYLAGWIIWNWKAKDATSAAASMTVLSGWFMPSGTPSCGCPCCVPRTEGGILNEQTGALVPLPAFIPQMIVAQRMPVPNLGIFVMALCRQTQC